MRDILDAMRNLHLFLCNLPCSTAPSEFPEQTDCGKFIALYKTLKDYYDEWTQQGGGYGNADLWNLII